ncbi:MULTISPECIES: hypothetical protein [Actinomyces]|uniref:hypothetical protein n=1 Tax=Actinomyces TaxID=1654 RepID=UPI00135ADD58|nr:MULTISPECIES: hypothetical protein [Actinomyces]
MTNHHDDNGLESTRPLTRRERRGLERLGEAQAQRQAAQKRAAEALAAEKRAAEARAAEQRAEARRRAAERRAAERRVAELRAEQQRQAAEHRAAEEARLRAQRAEAERVEEARRLEAARAEAAHLEAERREAERLAAERLAAQRRAAQEARRLEAERADEARAEALRARAPRAAHRLPETRSSEAGPGKWRGFPGGSSDRVAPEAPPAAGGQRALGAALNRSRPRGHAALILVCLAVAAIIILPLALSIVNGKSPASTAMASPAATMLPADTPLDQAMSVSGRVGARPVVKLKAPLSAPSSLIKDTLITGEGRALQSGDAALLSIATFSGTDGKNTTTPGADSEGNEHTGRRLVSVSVDQASLNELTDIVKGTTEGTRLVLRGPVVVDGATSTEITVIDVLPTLASGTAVAPVAGMPAVIPGDSGGVTLSLAGLPAPTRSTAAVLIQGTGEQVHSDSRIIARVQAISWTDGSVITNDYGAKVLPVAVDLSNAKTYAGLRNHLVDVPVGSRVVLALPADQARGDRPVAVVVDILAIEDPKTDASGAGPGATPTIGSDPEISNPAPAATAGN